MLGKITYAMRGYARRDGVIEKNQGREKSEGTTRYQSLRWRPEIKSLNNGRNTSRGRTDRR